MYLFLIKNKLIIRVINYCWVIYGIDLWIELFGCILILWKCLLKVSIVDGI